MAILGGSRLLRPYGLLTRIRWNLGSVPRCSFAEPFGSLGGGTNLIRGDVSALVRDGHPPTQVGFKLGAFRGRLS